MQRDLGAAPERGCRDIDRSHMQQREAQLRSCPRFQQRTRRCNIGARAGGAGNEKNDQGGNNRMRTRVGQDFLTGLLFAVIGIGALVIGADYPMGTPQRPGTGVLPRILAWGLLGIGGLLIIKAVLGGDTPSSKWAWKPLALVTLATVVFGLTVDSLGLVISMAASMTLCALATPETRWPEYGVFLLIMLAIGVGMFIWLLGMPIPIWPVKVPDVLSIVVR
jgi:hypothetical protein